jgi:hypothetical protein
MTRHSAKAAIALKPVQGRLHQNAQAPGTTAPDAQYQRAGSCTAAATGQKPGATCEMKSLGTRLPSHSTKMRPLSSKYAPASLMYAPVSGTVGGSRTLRQRGRLPRQ